MPNHKVAGLLVVAVVATAAVAFVATTAANSAPSKQRVVLHSDGSDAAFVITPASPGRLSRDRGTASFCCWSSHSVMRDGQRVDITKGPRVTLVGRQGTIETQNRMEWLGVPGGYNLFTGTWKVVRGTGTYAGVTGGGRLAGVQFPSSEVLWRYEGFLGTSR